MEKLSFDAKSMASLDTCETSYTDFSVQNISNNISDGEETINNS